LFSGGTMRRIRLEILALCAWVAGLAIFVVLNDVARHVAPQLGAACLAIGLLCGWRRLWAGAAVWMVTAIIALWPILPNYLPYHAEPGAGCRLAVVTFNHLEGHPDDAGAAKLLAGLHPDIVLAQKVYDTEAFRDALLAAGFGGYHSFLSPGNSELILSRFPIIRTQDDRDGIWSDVAISGVEVRLRGLYAPRPVGETGKPALYRDYYARLEQEIAARGGPLIVAGDGNASIFTPEIRNLRKQLRDTWDESGFGLGATFPGPWRRMGVFGPFVRIDYILHNGAFAAVAARRIDDAAGAGHFPVWAELSFLGHGEAGGRCQ
jgi:vancomycin resistance protein VanJ